MTTLLVVAVTLAVIASAILGALAAGYAGVCTFRLMIWLLVLRNDRRDPDLSWDRADVAALAGRQEVR